MSIPPEKLIEEVLRKKGVLMTEGDLELAKKLHALEAHQHPDLINFICNKFLINEPAVVNDSSSTTTGIYPKIDSSSRKSSPSLVRKEKKISSNKSKTNGIYPQLDNTTTTTKTTTLNNSSIKSELLPIENHLDSEESMDLKRLEDIVSGLVISQKHTESLVTENFNDNLSSSQLSSTKVIKSNQILDMKQHIQDELVKSVVRNISTLVNNKNDLTSLFSNIESVGTVMKDLNTVVDVLSKSNSIKEALPRHVRSADIKNQLIHSLDSPSDGHHVINIKKISDMTTNQVDVLTNTVSNLNRLHESYGSSNEWIRIAQSEAYKISNNHKDDSNNSKQINYQNSYHVRSIKEHVSRLTEDLLAYALVEYTKVNEKTLSNGNSYYKTCSKIAKDVVNRLVGRFPDSYMARMGFSLCAAICESIMKHNSSVIHSRSSREHDIRFHIDSDEITKEATRVYELILDYNETLKSKSIKYSSNTALLLTNYKIKSYDSYFEDVIVTFVSQFKDLVKNPYFGHGQSSVTHVGDIIFATVLSTVDQSNDTNMTEDKWRMMFLKCLFCELFYMASRFISIIIRKGITSSLTVDEANFVMSGYDRLTKIMASTYTSSKR